MADKNLPSHDVFTVTGNETKRWTRIGAAFANKDGKGYNVSLDAMPVNGALVLREYEAHQRPEQVQSHPARRLSP
jgi:hypothetical protein